MSVLGYTLTLGDMIMLSILTLWAVSAAAELITRRKK